MSAPPTLWAAALLSLLAMATYSYVGWRLKQRRVSAENRLPTQGFALWWFGLSGVQLVQAFNEILGARDLLTLNLLVASTHVAIAFLVASLFGLVYYLFFLFTGQRRGLLPIALFYVSYYILLVDFITRSQPNGLDVRAWRVTLSYENALVGPFYQAVVALLLLPPLLSAIAYLSLLPRAREPTQKYRILLVAMAILLWFGSSLLAAAGRPNFSDAWAFSSRVIGLGAAGIILLGYHPPRWIRERWGVRSISQDPRPSPSGG